MPGLVRSWPRAIIHVDCDAFFASCEQAVNPKLKGKPVVTGKERNIVAAASYEAKALGIKRGVALWDAKKMCPDLVVLPSDYETYSLFSKRMFQIMRRFTPSIEEYSIDEGFAEITGLRRVHRCSYPEIAKQLQHVLTTELGIGITVGVSLTKTLAKIASKKKKPKGFTVISGQERETVLGELPIEEVWNVGPNTSELLKRFGILTALDFANRPEEFVRKVLTKPGIETWNELNGRVMWELETAEKEAYQTISKTKTFTPPSSDKDVVFAQLMKNAEAACMKARRYHQAAKKIIIFLRLNDHHALGLEAKLIRPSCFPNEITQVIRDMYDQLYSPKALYRSTGVILSDLVSSTATQVSLFEQKNQIEKTRRLYGALDSLRSKYGKYAVHHAVSLSAQKTQHLNSRGDIPVRKSLLLQGETKRQRLPLPLIQLTV